MNMPHPHRFWSPGPAEHILGKAGLFNVIDTKVSPARRLTRLLGPLPDKLLPPLVDQAEICSLEFGGAIDTYTHRARSLRPERAWPAGWRYRRRV